MQSMNETIEIRIRFDGETAGLREHRLSIAAFNQPLGLLLKAFRRAVDAVADSGNIGQERSRRFGKHAEHFDLQLTSIADGCVQLGFTCVVGEANGSFPAIQAREAVDRVVNTIAREARGQSTGSPSIRRYLESLPPGVTSQKYQGLMNGQVIAQVELGSPTAIEKRRSSPPRVVTIRGRVTAVTFDTEYGQVRIRQLSGPLYRCRATSELVDQAVELRRTTVVAKLLVRHELTTLLSVYPESKPPVPLNPEERVQHIVQQWDGTLRRLAE